MLDRLIWSRYLPDLFGPGVALRAGLVAAGLQEQTCAPGLPGRYCLGGGAPRCVPGFVGPLTAPWPPALLPAAARGQYSSCRSWVREPAAMAGQAASPFTLFLVSIPSPHVLQA